MKYLLKKLLIIASFLTVFGTLALPAQPALALFDNAKTAACQGIDVSATSTSCTDSSTKIDSLVRLAINIFSVVIGVIAVIMIIIGGLRYITSAGDSNAVSGAKNTLLYAIVGLVVVALAQVIVRFVLAKVPK
ncbi:MAG TPA: hypothetical protein VLG25_02250 [Patescibacteria group bacterium]|nr:hypothetical protein [Patescibacteria group bacterium]